MKLLRLLVGCSGLAIGLAAGSLAAEPLDEIARSMSERLAAITSLEQDGAIVVEFDVRETRESTRMPFSFLYEKPGRLLMSNEFLFAVSTGKELVLRGVRPDRYALTPLPDEQLRGLERLQPILWRSLLPDKRALLSEHPEEALSDYFRRSGALRMEDEKAGDTDCWVIELAARDLYWLKTSRARFWIDQSNGLIRRIEPVGEPKGEAAATASGDILPSAEFRYEVERARINEPIAPDRFAFNPAPHERQVEAVVDLFGGDEYATPGELETEKQALESRRALYRTVMDTNCFALLWSVESDRQTGLPQGRERVRNRMPLRRFLAIENGRLIVINPADGKTMGEVVPPVEAMKRNEQEEWPRFLFLETAEGGCVVAVQTFYRVEERDTGHAYFPSESTLHGFDLEGRLLWSRTLARPFHIESLGILPRDGGSDLLLISVWDGFTLVDAVGKVLLTQKIGFADSVEIADRDGDGTPEFYVIGTSPACYKWIAP